MKRLRLFLLVFILSAIVSLSRNTQALNTKEFYNEYVDKGAHYLKQNQLDKAKYFFRKANELFPDEPEAYVNLGIISIQRRNFVNAVKLLHKAKLLAGDSYGAKDVLLYNIGLCLQRMEDYPEAIKYYREVIEINPEFEGAVFFNLGVSYAQTGQEDLAYLNIAKARCIFEQNGETERIQKTDEFLVSLINSTSGNVSLAQRLLEEGSLAFENNKIEEAIILLKISGLICPKYAEAYYRIGVIYVSQNDFEAALKYFAKTIEADPNLVKAYINLGSTYGKLNEDDKALESFNKAVILENDNPVIYYNIGVLYKKMKQNKEARRYLDKAKVLCRKTGNNLLLEKIKQNY